MINLGSPAKMTVPMFAIEARRILPVAVAILAALVGGLSSASASTLIKCDSENSPQITITLKAFNALGESFNCISSELFVDLTPCAPDGKFGLSAPTGSVDIVRIADRWQDYMNHFGGVTGNQMSASQIYFNLGFAGSDGFDEKWRFMVNRLDGTGTLSDGKGKVEAVYQCTQTKAQF